MPAPDRDADLDLVDLLTASNPPMAEMLVQILRDHDVHAYVRGRFLQDEFAMSQVLLGNTGVTIQVPSRERERAKTVLEENWGPLPGDRGGEPTGDEPTADEPNRSSDD